MERFTGHYVFCLALSRFLCLAHWVLQLVDRNGTLVYALGRGPWAALVLIAEGVQTFILTDFTLLYISAYARGIPVVRVAEGIV